MAANEHGLGKNLMNVFARTARRESSANRGYLEVELGQIIPPAANPRTHLDETALDELAASIREHGILQPIVVIRRDVGFEVLAGERRYRAAKRAGLTMVPVVIRDEPEPEQLAELRLIENIQREDLNALEIARAYSALISQHGLSQDQVAERVGKDKTSVSNSLRLLTLPESVQTLVEAGQLAMAHARALIAIKDPERCLVLAQRAIDEGLSARVVEALVRDEAAQAASPSPASAPAGRPPKPTHLRELEANLGRLFGTDVSIKERAGKGALTLRFHSKAHFKQIMEQLDAAFHKAQRNDS